MNMWLKEINLVLDGPKHYMMETHTGRSIFKDNYIETAKKMIVNYTNFLKTNRLDETYTRNADSNLYTTSLN